MASSLYKWLIYPFFLLVATSAVPPSHHPFHVSVTEINHNAAEKSLEISCKVFLDDFEKILEQQYKTKVDLNKASEKTAMDKLVKDYILKHISISIDGKPVALSYLGFEAESEAVYAYVEGPNVPKVTKAEVTDNLLYDMYNDQLGIVHVIVNGERKSTKINYPETKVTVQF
jgi:hypothetical protein